MRTLAVRKMAILATSVAAALVSIAGCGSSGTTAAGSPSQVITIQQYPGGFTSWVTYIALQKGFFKRAGLNVELKTLPSGQAATAAMVGGSIDISLIDLFNTAPLLVQGYPLVDIVQQLKIGQTLIAAPGIPKAGLAKTFPLKPGTTVGAYSVAGASALEVRYLQGAFGGNANSVKIVADPTVAGLNKTTEPYAYANPNVACVLATKGATAVASLAAQDPSYPAAVNTLAGLPDNGYWALKSWIDTHKSEANALQRAVIQATQWAKGHVSEAASILRASSEFNLPTLSDSQFSSCVQGIAQGWSTSLTGSDVTRYQTLLRSVGTIPSSTKLPPMSQWTLPGV